MRYFRSLFFLAIALLSQLSQAQPCGINTPSFTVNLTGFPQGSWLSPSVVRDDQCCGVTPPDKCVEFWITLDPGAVGIRFDIVSGAIPPGALYYELNCLNPTQVGDTMCITGVGPHRITFCKPGNNQNEYLITSIPAPQAGPATVAQDGCTGIFSCSGYDESTIVWTSISPGPPGFYNNYLSCTTGCDTTIVTALPGYPPSVLYQVCGLPLGACASQQVCDTVRVYFVSNKTATILPQNPVICFGGPPATLTANGTGGAPPYSYLWSTGGTTQSIVVGAGTYWVQINDTTNCPPVYDTVTVIANPSLIIANAGLNDTICSYNGSINLNGSVQVATGGIWIGGNGTFNPNDTTLNAVYFPSPGEISAGVVTLYLITTGNGLCPADTDTVSFAILQPPIAAFSTSPVCLNQSTSFTDLSTVVTGNIVSWNWNFGDAGTSTVQNPVHIYAASGIYTVTLIVTSSNGCIDTIQQNITVNPLPVAAFSNTAQCYVDSVYFTDNSTISSGSITTWNWNFGDPPSGPNNTSTLQNPSHFYSTPGNYTVTLIVTSQAGCSDTIILNITVNPSPLADFAATEVCFGQQTFFTDSSSISSGNIISWSWDFGDASNSTLQSPSHNYPSPGTYTVTLIVTSNNGCTDTITQIVTIHPLPVAAFNSLGACLSDGITFTDLSTILAPDSIVSWFWDFGDASTSILQDPVHFYPSTGNFGVILIVTSSFGCTDTILQAVTVNPSPTAGFVTNLTIVVINQTVNFTDQSIGAITWFWNFGDGIGTSNLANPSYTYATGGTYIVMQVVTNQFGCTDTAWYEVIVTMPPQVPSGFSPNGDNENDILYVLGGPYKKLEFRIYNNWGELIFISDNQGNGWNGTRKDKKQPMSVYIYTVFAITEDDKEHFLKGDVTLLR